MDRDSCGLLFTNGPDGPLDNAFRLGYQYDCGDSYCVLARSDNGIIPGKAKPGGDKCWYPYGGEEHECDDFEWISSNGHVVLIRPTKGEDEDPPEGALRIGRQDDGDYYVVIAHTEEGDIPGKSKDGRCWYTSDGKAKNASNFSYVIARHGWLHDGARIHLDSQHGGSIRVTEDNEVDGSGGHGHWATFIVLRNEHDGTVRLQNEKRPNRFLAIRKCGLTTGAGGRYCVFKPNFHKNGTVTFMSVNFPGRHIGINDDKTAQDPKHTGTGINARFNVIIKSDLATMVFDGGSCGLQFTDGPNGPVNDAFRLGHQYDTGDDYYCVLALTDNGYIPGKAIYGADLCDYGYDREERQTKYFVWLNSDGQKVIKLEKNPDYPPEGALLLGRQDDGSYHVVIAHTEEGDIPGKSLHGRCWYTYDGKEKNANNVSYVIGINDDQTARDPKHTGTGINARFNVIVKEDD